MYTADFQKKNSLEWLAIVRVAEAAVRNSAYITFGI